MIHDLEQPAKDWVADHIENFGVLLNKGDDPSCLIRVQGCEIEIRLNKVPGLFERSEQHINVGGDYAALNT
ncbi:hypothetical protein [Marinobacterium stanieri]|uniref:Uncharacterized protein n=1 Tax=Marinobacterium stanieri TaxID=49186 RepID=A0A1N6RN81_9GAMM|nr:hypothetical protein [Marinobacterium stanieri]SIQ30136.1 hypothetical protein SAMN05421647_103423 [Marinobacterium stanieri]